MTITKKQRNNIIFIVFIAILIIPQTRRPIQILLHKGLALFSPSIVDEKERSSIVDYNWKLIDENGATYDFREAKGKVVLVNFWATWCPPCVAEMPSLEKLYAQYKDDIVFLLVTNENHDVVTKFKNKHDYDFLFYSAITKNPDIFDVSSIPRTYVIDKYGKIAIDKSGAANWNSDLVKELLEGLLKSE